MSIAEISSTTRRVTRHYEALPYPYRDPADEARRLLITATDELAEINHYCFRGRRDFRNDFRLLVAGGGTGDATVFLGCQLRQTNAQIVHLDLSAASIAVARERARAHGIEDRIEWIQASLLDLDPADLEPFDFINCCGVLHHLEDPSEGLDALCRVLKPDGALGMMVYGKYGRRGIYQVQDLMRLINHDLQDEQAMVENTRRVLSSLPPTNVAKMRMPLFVNDNTNDAEIYDKFLHSRDRAYTVAQLYELLDGAGLHLAQFNKTDRHLYCPHHAFGDSGILEEVIKLPLPMQQTAAELFWGTIGKHIFWASRQSDSVADPHDPENVPHYSRWAQMYKLPRSLRETKGQQWECKLQRSDGITYTIRVPMTLELRALVDQIDEQRPIADIIPAAAAQRKLSTGAMWQAWLEIFAIFEQHDILLLRHQSVPGFVK